MLNVNNIVGISPIRKAYQQGFLVLNDDGSFSPANIAEILMALIEAINDCCGGGTDPNPDCEESTALISIESVKGNIVNIVGTFSVDGRDVDANDCVGLLLTNPPGNGGTYTTAKFGDTAEIVSYASTLQSLYGITKPDGSPIDASNVSWSTGAPWELVLVGVLYEKSPQNDEAVEISSYIVPKCLEDCDPSESEKERLCLITLNNGAFLYHGTICEGRNWQFDGAGIVGPYTPIPPSGATLWLQGLNVSPTTPIDDSVEDLTEINLGFGTCPAPDNVPTINPDNYSLIDYQDGYKTFHQWHANGFVTSSSRFHYLWTHLRMLDCNTLEISASTLNNDDGINAFDWEISPGSFTVSGTTASAGNDPLVTVLDNPAILQASQTVTAAGNGVSGEVLGTIDISTLSAGWHTWRAKTTTVQGKEIESTWTFLVIK